jgi:hydroxymethylpyrimidine pyrophosphatase-like HAD family hydrolase
MIPFKLSELPHTWFIDLDGTVLLHNAHLSGQDELLPGVKEFWNQIPQEDFIVITTGRSTAYKKSTLKFLKEHNLRFNAALFELPLGERIIINDIKPAGLKTAISWNVERNQGFIKE